MTDEDLKEVVSVRRMTAIVAANNDVFKDNAKAMSLTAALNDDITALDASSASAISAMGL